MTLGYRIEIRATVSYFGGKPEATGWGINSDLDDSNEAVLAGVNQALRLVQDDIKSFVRFGAARQIAEASPEVVSTALADMDSARKAAL